MGLDERLAAGEKHETQPNYCSEMTPKDKANELVDKFFNITATMFLADCGRKKAKECAMIAVEEIIDALVGCHTAEEWGNYWNEVKSEIEKL